MASLRDGKSAAGRRDARNARQESGPITGENHLSGKLHSRFLLMRQSFGDPQRGEVSRTDLLLSREAFEEI